METILKDAKADTVDMLVDMIFGDMKASEIMEISSLTEEERRNVVLVRMREICEGIKIG
jgi:hypothetical protein